MRIQLSLFERSAAENFGDWVEIGPWPERGEYLIAG
jgi:hypothetical protein